MHSRYAFTALLFVGLLLGEHASAASRYLPIRALTPGLTDPRVTQTNIKTTICVSGYTATVRPPTSYTNKLKADQLKDPKYHDADHTMAHYEEDHLIPLELGGHPTDPRNLWPEPYASQQGAKIKDHLEDRLKRLVCAGTVTLHEAQDAIATDWI